MRYIVAMLFVALVGCQSAFTSSPLAGTGPIRLSSQAYGGYQYYLQQDGIAYAVTNDGQGGYAYYCLEFGCAKLIARFSVELVNSCERHYSRPCSVFAVGDTVVWENPGDWDPTGALSSSGTSTVSSKNEAEGSAEGDRRNISVEWEGQEGILNGWIDIAAESFFVEFADGTICEGNIEPPRSGATGTWGAECENGVVASGTFEGRGNRQGSVGEGVDSDGNAIHFDVSAAQS